MKKYMIGLAALSLLLSGCGNDETPKSEKAAGETTMQEGQGTSMEQQQSAGAMTEAPAMGEGQTSEPAGMTEGTMAEAPAAAAEQPMAGSQTAPASETAPAGGEAMAAADKGKQVYDSICFACHSTGAAGAPKFGDKTAWAPRIAQGMDTLFTHAINGFQGKSGVMPPKGGGTNLSDEDVKAAVTYMVDNSK